MFWAILSILIFLSFFCKFFKSLKATSLLSKGSEPPWSVSNALSPLIYPKISSHFRDYSGGWKLKKGQCTPSPPLLIYLSISLFNRPLKKGGLYLIWDPWLLISYPISTVLICVASRNWLLVDRVCFCKTLFHYECKIIFTL